MLLRGQVLKQGPHVCAIHLGQIVQHREVMAACKLDETYGLPRLAAGTGVFARVPNQRRQFIPAHGHQQRCAIM